MRVVAFAGLVCLFILASPARADACSCRAPGPPCEEIFWGTVFVGKAVSAQEVPKKLDTRYTFEVIEVLNGTITTKTVDVSSPSEGSMCGIKFRIGATYVVYAGGDAKTGLGSGLCSRTHVLRENDEDVAFARAAKKSTATKAHVAGTVSISGERSQPAAGVEVRVKGTKLAAKTDAKGAFAFDLAVGNYELEVVAKGLRPWRGEKLGLGIGHAAWCPRPHITMAWDGQIQGRVTYADGKPASGVKVTATAATGPDRAWRVDGVTADNDGRYTLHEMQEGDWNVVVSPPEEGHPSAYSPHPTTYFPGTPDITLARDVPMKRAGLVQNIDFVVPAPHTVVTIHVDVTRADGTPAVKSTVGIVPKGVNRSTAGGTDDKGAFSTMEITGLEILVRACDPDDWRKCTEVTTKTDLTMKPIAITLPK